MTNERETMTDTQTSEAPRRTKRRYAHELFPHPAEDEVRPLAVEVPYLYARALGYEVWGTDWFDLSATDPRAGADRTHLLLESRDKALLADALHQGMSGDEAWAWVVQRTDETGEWIWERAVHYGVDPDAIKPYPVRAEPRRHDHWTERDAHGVKTLVEAVDCPESECESCTEPVEVRR